MLAVRGAPRRLSREPPPGRHTRRARAPSHRLLELRGPGGDIPIDGVATPLPDGGGPPTRAANDPPRLPHRPRQQLTSRPRTAASSLLPSSAMPQTDTADPTLKAPADSATEMVQIVLPNDANPLGFILGGTVMHLIDIAGAIAGHRHTRSRIVTAAVDGLQFLHPINVGDLIILKSHVTCTFRTSLEVEVEVYCEETLTGDRKLTSRAYLTFVAVDSQGGRVPIPSLRLDTAEIVSAQRRPPLAARPGSGRNRPSDRRRNYRGTRDRGSGPRARGPGRRAQGAGRRARESVQRRETEEHLRPRSRRPDPRSPDPGALIPEPRPTTRVAGRCAGDRSRRDRGSGTCGRRFRRPGSPAACWERPGSARRPGSY